MRKGRRESIQLPKMTLTGTDDDEDDDGESSGASGGGGGNVDETDSVTIAVVTTTTEKTAMLKANRRLGGNARGRRFLTVPDRPLNSRGGSSGSGDNGSDNNNDHTVSFEVGGT